MVNQKPVGRVSLVIFRGSSVWFRTDQAPYKKNALFEIASASMFYCRPNSCKRGQVSEALVLMSLLPLDCGTSGRFDLPGLCHKFKIIKCTVCDEDMKMLDFFSQTRFYLSFSVFSLLQKNTGFVWATGGLKWAFIAQIKGF